MKIVPLYNPDIIRDIMMHEDILPTIIDDTWDGTVIKPDLENEIFLGCVVNGDLIGLYNLHWITGVTLQGHTHILKKYRKEHAQASCFAVMKWLLENVERCEKVACFVPFVYPNVKRFLAACGFSEEGVIRKSFLLNKKLHDMWIMGLSRAVMQEKTSE